MTSRIPIAAFLDRATLAARADEDRWKLVHYVRSLGPATAEAGR